MHRAKLWEYHNRLTEEYQATRKEYHLKLVAHIILASTVGRLTDKIRRELNSNGIMLCYSVIDEMIFRCRAALVVPLRSPARNSVGVFREPVPHLVMAPCPLERVGIQPLVLRPRRADVFEEQLTTRPRCTPQVAMPEGPDQQLRLIQPRGMGRREPWSPPVATAPPVGGRVAGCRTRVAILDKKTPLSPRCRRRKSRNCSM